MPRIGLWSATISAIVLAGIALWFVLAETDEDRERRQALDWARTVEPERAIAVLEQALERLPGDPLLLAALVEVMERNGTSPVELEPIVVQWCKSNPKDPNAWRMRFRVAEQMQQIDELITAGEHLLALDPQDQQVREKVAVHCLLVERFADAERHFETLLETGRGRHPEWLIGLARAKGGLRDVPEAERLLGRVLKDEPDHPGALLWLGVLYLDQDDPVRAIPFLKGVRPRSYGERLFALNRLGQAYARAGREQDAQATFALLGRIQEAMRLRQDAPLRPEDVSLQVRAARALLETDQTSEALTFLESVLRRGDHRELLELLAECQERLGRPDLAAATRQRVKQLSKGGT